MYFVYLCHHSVEYAFFGAGNRADSGDLLLVHGFKYRKVDDFTRA